MLSTARPLFENLPGTFADPFGLADQQAPGTTSLVLARYLDDENPPRPVYDAFVVASGGVVAVSRSTPDYRFPVAPAAAVRRFLDARDHGAPPALSLYEVAPDDSARFLESTYFAECLKLHVDGPGSAALVADQLARCGCTSGLLEVNDFSDPTAPRLALTEWTGDATALDALLDGARGRVLLYDREKNRAVAADRAGAHPDPFDAIAEAERLATARRRASGVYDANQDTTAQPAPLLAEAVEHELRQPRGRRSQPHEPAAAPEAADPHATGLAALVAELQGAPLPAPQAETDDDDDAPSSQAPQPPATSSLLLGEGQSEEPQSDDALVSTEPTPDPHVPADALPVPISQPPVPASASEPPHPLAKPLDALRVEVYALLEEHVGQDRALSHDAHVTADADLPAPVPSEHVPAYLRALLTADPPRRWHFFKRSRQKCYEAVAARLLAFHGAHGHDARDGARQAVHEIAQLWARIHR